jgi:hypothetical protein
MTFRNSMMASRVLPSFKYWSPRSRYLAIFDSLEQAELAIEAMRRTRTARYQVVRLTGVVSIGLPPIGDERTRKE